MYDVITDEVTFEFQILPPWYRSWWAYIGYVLWFGLTIFLSIKFYTRRLKEQNLHLEQLVSERTVEIRKQNEQILTKNTEITQQKEEIQAQAEALEQINNELEKLSIVARETDNSVAIFDKDYNLEWVNEGFTRMYGYDYEEFVSKNGRNLVDTSANATVKTIIENCLSSKKSVNYESFNFTKDGRQIWVQTTITPILNNFDYSILKLIAIDTDISRLKEAEIEIKQRSEEITAQRDEILEQSRQIETQNEHIKSSIRYANTIQRAILPNKSLIDKYFDSFIIYKPKDIVSGDFYWHTMVNLKMSEFDEASNFQIHFVAVVDCTGHGVPGAFMSMIGNRLFNEIVNERQIYEPGTILDLISANIRLVLRQGETDNNDGMDVCLCKIIKKEDETHVTFSGCKRPLIYLDSRNDKIISIKGDIHSIGGYKTRTSDIFSEHNITLVKGDIMYLSTDGYIDQNDVAQKRLGSVRFLGTLQQIASLPLPEQQAVLEKELKNYMDNSDQRDDITVVGLKIT